MTPKILILADINSTHTQKWVLGLSNDNFKIGIFSFNASESNWFKDKKNIICLNKKEKKSKLNLLNKLAYLLFWPRLIYQIFKFKPDVIHSHYASSYGLLGALTFFKPFIVSAWGSDLMEFPTKNWLNKLMIKFVLYRADEICVTSSVLQKEISLYTKKQSKIIPFGINLNLFYSNRLRNNIEFIFGCVKNLEPIYNIDKTVLAFSLLLKKYPHLNLKLKIIGHGSQKNELINLMNQCGIQNNIKFIGAVPHDQIPYYLNRLDVFINVSEIESFGVSIAEAMACKIPVIVSNLEGFKDLVPDESVGLITASTSPEDIFIAMEKTLLNSELRMQISKNAYQRIIEKFNWSQNLNQMEDLYFELA
ncbi:MAG: glycosyltransferase [Bacteroidota bacterium]|nr:glycosyltransferase [Bacteroidota bacterium]MDP3144629.1 glycosyltransferase [Bacteroidota bacterium]MDP3556568.1 glycosyltransferase [Bacteroidota bacterium]